MIEGLDKMYELIKEKLTQQISNYEYRYERYNQNYSIAIAYTTENIDLSQMDSYIRTSDSFIKIQPNLCAVILDFTDGITGVQAANKLLTSFNNTFYEKQIFAAVATANEHTTTMSLINELFNILKFGLTNDMDNLVLDSSYLD